MKFIKYILISFICLTGYAELENKNLPKLLDLGAGKCIPCKMMEPILETLASRYINQLKIGKINVDEEAELANQYSIVSIPSMLIFKNGEVELQQVGALGEALLEKKITGLLPQGE